MGRFDALVEVESINPRFTCLIDVVEMYVVESYTLFAYVVVSTCRLEVDAATSSVVTEAAEVELLIITVLENGCVVVSWIEVLEVTDEFVTSSWNLNHKNVLRRYCLDLMPFFVEPKNRWRGFRLICKVTLDLDDVDPVRKTPLCIAAQQTLDVSV